MTALFVVYCCLRKIVVAWLFYVKLLQTEDWQGFVGFNFGLFEESIKPIHISLISKKVTVNAIPFISHVQ